jgi:hypothetical protein
MLPKPVASPAEIVEAMRPVFAKNLGLVKSLPSYVHVPSGGQLASNVWEELLWLAHLKAFEAIRKEVNASVEHACRYLEDLRRDPWARVAADIGELVHMIDRSGREAAETRRDNTQALMNRAEFARWFQVATCHDQANRLRSAIDESWYESHRYPRIAAETHDVLGPYRVYCREHGYQPKS